jgi:hypothetical protein
MVIIRSLGSDGSQGVAMAAKSLSSVMKVSFNCYMGLEDKQNVGVSLEPIQLVSNWEG